MNRLAEFESPGEKINCLMGVLADAKSELMLRNKGRVLMDEEAEPLIIACVLLRSNIEAPMAEVAFLKDWDNNMAVTITEDALKIIINQEHR